MLNLLRMVKGVNISDFKFHNKELASEYFWTKLLNRLMFQFQSPVLFKQFYAQTYHVEITLLTKR